MQTYWHPFGLVFIVLCRQSILCYKKCMNRGFWDKLNKPIMVLAPMADVTDTAYRLIIAKYGKPDVMWTEFVACDGLCSKEGKKNLRINLKYTEAERPIIAQIFGANPKHFYECAKLIKKLGFDGIDINMGCPEKAICKQGAGAALIKNPELAKEIIYETKRGAGKLPISVKTRAGYNKEDLKNWLECLIKAQPAVIVVHARTKKEMSKVPANWKLLGRVIKDIKKKIPSGKMPLIIGNGDIKNLAEAHKKAEKYSVDGVMIGRGVFGNPWFFSKRDSNRILLADKLKVLIEHTKLYEKLLGDKKPFDNMKKHFKAYVSGFAGAKQLRMQLMACQSAEEVKGVIDSFSN